MAIKFGSIDVSRVFYNGVEVKELVFNNESVWLKPYNFSVDFSTGYDSVYVVIRDPNGNQLINEKILERKTYEVKYKYTYFVRANLSAGYKFKETINPTYSGTINSDGGVNFNYAIPV